MPPARDGDRRRRVFFTSFARIGVGVGQTFSVVAHTRLWTILGETQVNRWVTHSAETLAIAGDSASGLAEIRATSWLIAGHG